MSDLGWGLVLLGGYVLLVMLARWIYIARTNVVWTGAQAAAMTRRLWLQAGYDSPGNSKAPVAKSTLRQLLADIKNENPSEQAQRHRRLEWLPPDRPVGAHA